jgi:hypothetical protein
MGAVNARDGRSIDCHIVIVVAQIVLAFEITHELIDVTGFQSELLLSIDLLLLDLKHGLVKLRLRLLHRLRFLLGHDVLLPFPR